MKRLIYITLLLLVAAFSFGQTNATFNNLDVRGTSKFRGIPYTFGAVATSPLNPTLHEVAMVNNSTFALCRMDFQEFADSIYNHIAQLWYLDIDTLKTVYHVKIDSSFLMQFKGTTFGYNDPTGLGNDSTLTMTVGDFSLPFGSSVSSLVNNGVPEASITAIDNFMTNSFFAVKPNYAIIGTDSLVYLSPPEEKSKYLLAYNSISNEVTIMDTSGFIGGNPQLWRLDSPDTIKTIYNVVVDSSFLMKYNGVNFGYEPYSSYPDVNDIEVGTYIDRSDTLIWNMTTYLDNSMSINSGVLIADTMAQISIAYDVTEELSKNPSISFDINDGTQLSLYEQTEDSIKLFVADGIVKVTADSTVIDGDLNVTGQVKYDYKHLVIYTTGGAYTPNVANGVEFKLTPSFSTTENDGFTFAGDSITIVTPGDYFVIFSTVLQGANGSDWGFKCRKNGTAITTGNLALSTIGAGNYITGMWDWYLLSLAAGDDISFSVTNEGGTDDPTFRSIKVFMEMKPE